MNLEQYQIVPYLDGGRTVSEGLDCFGLVRHALHHQFNGPLLNSFSGIFRSDHADMTNEFHQSVGQFKQCKPQTGAIACCFHKTANGDVFHHVGICVDESNVMHTSATRGYSVVPVRTFKRLALKVEFYKYANENTQCQQ